MCGRARAIDVLIKAAEAGNDHAKLCAVAALLKCAKALSAEQTSAAVPALLAAARSMSGNGPKVAARALLAMDRDKSRDAIVGGGGIALFAHIARTANTETSVAAVAVLSSCAIENKHHSVILAEGGVAALVHVARMSELPAAGRGDVGLALYLLSRKEDCRAAIVQEGAIEVLRQMSSQRGNGSDEERLTRNLAIATVSIGLQACHPRSPSNSDSD